MGLAELKTEIMELYGGYQRRKLELGRKILELQERLAHPGNGKFLATLGELGIPISTAYDAMDHARREDGLVEIETQPESPYETRKDSPDESETLLDIDFSPAAWDKFIRVAYPEGAPEVAPPVPKSYVKKTLLTFYLTDADRLTVAAAWKVLRKDKNAMDKLNHKIVEEVVNAAAQIEPASIG